MACIELCGVQWPIQNFSDGMPILGGGGTNLLFGQFCAENCTEVFILHQDTDAIGYCSHFSDLCIGIGRSLLV